MGVQKAEVVERDVAGPEIAEVATHKDAALLV